VELGFTIPFITIPVKGVNDNEKPLVNVNVGAITAGTILTTAALIFIPKAFSGLEPEISFGKSKLNHSCNAFNFITSTQPAYVLRFLSHSRECLCFSLSLVICLFLHHKIISSHYGYILIIH
jgi:hypothetical protein